MSKEDADKHNVLLNDKQIAAIWGVTRSCVQQIRQRAMRKLREQLQNDPYVQEYLGDCE